MIYADVEFYQSNYLLGRKPVLPLGEFPFWEKKARQFMDLVCLGKIDERRLETSSDPIGQCACELAEYFYMNEGSENKQSEGIAGRSVTYFKGTEYKICQNHLFNLGLMYRGG